MVCNQVTLADLFTRCWRLRKLWFPVRLVRVSLQCFHVIRVFRGSDFQNLSKTIHETHESTAENAESLEDVYEVTTKERDSTLDE